MNRVGKWGLCPTRYPGPNEGHKNPGHLDIIATSPLLFLAGFWYGTRQARGQRAGGIMDSANNMLTERHDPSGKL